MKRALILVLSGLLAVLGLSACGESYDNDEAAKVMEQQWEQNSEADNETVCTLWEKSPAFVLAATQWDEDSDETHAPSESTPGHPSVHDVTVFLDSHC